MFLAAEESSGRLHSGFGGQANLDSPGSFQQVMDLLTRLAKIVCSPGGQLFACIHGRKTRLYVLSIKYHVREAEPKSLWLVALNPLESRPN